MKTEIRESVISSKLTPNPGKKIVIEVEGLRYARLPIRTHVIKETDDILEILRTYAAPLLAKNDYIFISERIVAITQGRAYPIKDIKPSRLANFLSKFVTKTPHGIGIGSPWTMELAIREAGFLRIFLGVLAAALTKPLGIRGAFYRVCGKRVASIDGPCSYTLAPYNEYAKLGPKNPDAVAESIKDALGYETVIIDANDLGVAVLGKSSSDILDDFAAAVFRDNPLGQSREQTPIGIVRRMRNW